MKTKKSKLEEIETSHTLGGEGGRTVREGRGEDVNVTLMSGTLR